MNKISVLWLGAGLVVAFGLTPHRRWLATPWPYVSGAIAFAFFVPFIVWQISHDYPMLEFIRNATARKMIGISPLTFLTNQVLTLSPLSLPVVLVGIVAPFVMKEMAGVRVLLFVFLTVTAILLASGNAKSYYLACAYPFVFVPGARALEALLEGMGWRRALRMVIPAVMCLNVFLVPFALPVLPVETFLRYAQSFGVTPAAQERHEFGPLPQHFADQFGWQELVQAVAKAYYALPPEERSDAVIFARNYGQAGAMDVLGRRLGLPRAISGHNSYWIWGPGTGLGNVIIIIGDDVGDHAKDFESMEEVGASDHPYAMPYERHRKIFIGRRLKVPPGDAWQGVRFYI